MSVAIGPCLLGNRPVPLRHYFALLQYATLRGSHVLLVSLISWFPCEMRCDEQLWYMRQTTAFDPNPKFTTDRYQRVSLHRSV